MNTRKNTLKRKSSTRISQLYCMKMLKYSRNSPISSSSPKTIQLPTNSIKKSSPSVMKMKTHSSSSQILPMNSVSLKSSMATQKNISNPGQATKICCDSSQRLSLPPEDAKTRSRRLSSSKTCLPIVLMRLQKPSKNS